MSSIEDLAGSIVPDKPTKSSYKIMHLQQNEREIIKRGIRMYFAKKKIGAELPATTSPEEVEATEWPEFNLNSPVSKELIDSVRDFFESQLVVKPKRFPVCTNERICAILCAGPLADTTGHRIDQTRMANSEKKREDTEAIKRAKAYDTVEKQKVADLEKTRLKLIYDTDLVLTTLKTSGFVVEAEEEKYKTSYEAACKLLVDFHTHISSDLLCNKKHGELFNAVSGLIDVIEDCD